VSVRATRFDDRLGVMKSMPSADLADCWLTRALTCLLDACGVPSGDRRTLIEHGVDEFEPESTRRFGTADEATRLERLDACSLALVFAALALETRLNRVLRRCGSAEWQAIAHLTPPEKFRLAPRLLDGLEGAAKCAELHPLVVELFDVRDELVDAGGSPRLPLHFGPSIARAMVEASARVCAFLATLTGEDESVTARLTLRAAEALAPRADALRLIRSPSPPDQERASNGDAEFPPDLVEW
jgi:hypothetical protein